MFANALQINARLRNQMQKTKGDIRVAIDRLQAEQDKISEALETEYTGYGALFKITDGVPKCLGVFDLNGGPSEELDEQEWDLFLPIPKPETMPEFSGW